MSSFGFGFSYPHSDSRGVPGYMAKPVGLHDNSDDFSRDRFSLRNSWNTVQYKDRVDQWRHAITPFRAVNNAGDPLGRVNYVCGGSGTIANTVRGLGRLAGGVHNRCDGSGVPGAVCNPKFVYDSSDYIRFKRQRAINHAYNDLSFSGDYSNANQSVLNGLRG